MLIELMGSVVPLAAVEVEAVYVAAIFGHDGEVDVLVAGVDGAEVEGQRVDRDLVLALSDYFA